MEVRFIEDKKNSAVFEVEGVGHGFCNILKNELSKEDNIKLVTYRIDHPLVGVPRFKIEGTDIRKTIKKVVDRLKKQTQDFKKKVSSL